MDAGGFTTAKGSTYTIHPDGTTTRNKAARPEHPDPRERGLQPRSVKTFYVDEEAARRLGPPQGKWVFIDHGDGTVSLATKPEGRRWGVAPLARRVPVSAEPGVGKIPLELWKPDRPQGGGVPYARAHFGNAITEMRGAPEAGGISVTPQVPARPSGKVLPTLDKEAAARAKELLKRQREERAAQKETERSHKGAEKLAKREQDAATVKSIFDAYDTPPLPANAAERKALGERLLAIVRAATEAGIKIPVQVKGFDPYIGLLKDARRLGTRIQKVSVDEIADYLGRESRTKAGMGEEVKAERTAEGERVARRAPAEGAEEAAPAAHGAVEAPRVESPEEIAIRREEAKTEDITEQGIRDIEIAARRATPQEIAALKYLAENAKTAGERNQALADLRRAELAEKLAKEQTKPEPEAPSKPKPPKLAEVEERLAKRRQEGPAEKEAPSEAAPVAPKAPVVVTRRGKREKFAPKLEEVARRKEKISLKERDAREEFNRREDARITERVLKQEKESGGLAVERRYKPSDLKRAARLRAQGDTALAKLQAEVIAREESKAAAARRGELYDNAGNRIPVIQTETLRQVLAHLSSFLPRGTIGSEMFIFLRSRLMNLVGDVPVHIVDNKGITSLANGPAGGFYSYDGYIALNVDILQSTSATTHAIMHEAVHAATVQALRANKKLAEDITVLAAEFYEFHTARGGNIRPHSYWTKFSSDYLIAAEFIAEAMSRADVQNDLANMLVSPGMAKRLGLDQKQPQTMWNAFVELVRRMIGVPEGAYTALEATMRMTERAITTQQEMQAAARQRAAEQAAQREQGLASPIDDFTSRVTDVARRAVGADDENLLPQQRVTRALRVMTMDQIAQYANKFWEAGVNPIRTITDLVQMTRTHGLKLRDLDMPTIKKGLQLAHKYQGAQWEEFNNVLHDETNAQVYADRPLDEQKVSGAFEKARAAELHPDLARRYRMLPQDLKDYRAEMHKFFRQRQDDLARGVMRNILRMELKLDHRDPAVKAEIEALVDRARHGKETLTEADKDLLGTNMQLLLDANRLGIRGPYVPLMRRGSHVLIGKYKVDPPSNLTGSAKQLTDETGQPVSVWEFTNRDDAINFYKRSPLHVSEQSVWVDKTTGSEWAVDVDGKQVRVTSADADAVQRWRVRVQDNHVEFFKNAREGQQAAKSYTDHGVFEPGSLRVEERRFTREGREVTLAAAQTDRLANSIVQRPGYQNLPDGAKAEFQRALSEFGMAMLGSTRISSRSLPRRYVQGASKDFVQNLVDYSSSTNAYRAKQEYMPDMEAADRVLEQTIKEDYSKQLGRSTIANIIREDMWSPDTVYGKNTKLSTAVNRILSVSSLKYLASPAYSLLQPLQLSMISAPYLGGQHGFAKAAREMFRAADDIGAGRITLEGLKEVGRKLRHGAEAEPSTLVEDMINRAAKNSREREMFQYIIDRGSLDPDAGLEVGALGQSGVGSKADRIIGYAEGVARAMPRAMEAINRGITGLAAYRLEYARTGDHAVSMRYAQESINNTQFLYAHSNMPTWFRHPLAQIPFQFKKFGQGMYHLLGQQIGKAIKGATREERMEGIRTLAALAASHTLMAGALGLPSEVARTLMIGARFAGLTDNDWEDVEAQFREFVAGYAGPAAGEALTRGITRALPAGLGFDLSRRVGMDNPLVFGEPRDNKRISIEGWAMEQLGGAPGSMLFEGIDAMQDIGRGDYLKGFEKLPVAKMGANMVRAYRQATEGTKTPAGHEQSKSYSVPEAIIRGIGFTPAREAEEQEFRRAANSATKSERDHRMRLADAWVNAETKAEKDQAQQAINTWNKAQPTESKITAKDLLSLQKRRKSDADAMVLGVKPTRRTEKVIDDLRGVYNIH